MNLEYAGIAKENINKGLDLNSISNTNRNKYIKNIFSKKSSDMLDWLDLTETSEEELNKIISCGEKIHKNFKNFIVLGIGGSALGIKMLKNTFVDSLHKDIGIRVEVCDNIDSDTFITLLDSLDLKKTMFNVITKSGTTSETLSQMLIAISRYKRKKIDFTKHFVMTTTLDNDLYKFAVENNIETFTIPQGVGGRFSILSPVGLLPASVMGLDIHGLIRGAKKSKENSQISDISNLAYNCAYINHSFLKAGRTNLVIMPYSDRLALVPDFFAQLWAESLGKKVDREGNIVYAGQTPIKTLGVTDQHSQLQLYSEGIQDKIIMFITVEKNCFDETIEECLPFAKHLQGATLKTLLDYEYSSTAYALTTLSRPNYTIKMTTITEDTMGELIFFMEMMTAFMGEMLNVNTYDQPGVELSKIYTKACLKVKGYEEYGKEIKEYSKKSKNFLV